MDELAAIVSNIPLEQFQKYLGSLNLDITSFIFFVSMFALLVSLVAFGRAGSKHSAGFTPAEAFQVRLDKLELSLADLRNRYANALSQLEMEQKSVQHDVAETKKIIEIVFSKRDGGGETAVDYQEYHRAPAMNLGMGMNGMSPRGAPLDVRISKKQEAHGEK